MSTSFVRFPYGGWNNVTPSYDTVSYHIVHEDDIIYYGTGSQLSIRRVGYGATTHKYVCVINGGKGTKDDTNTCYFTDDAVGYDAGGNHKAKEFLGAEVYATVGYQGNIGRQDTGYSVDSVTGCTVTSYRHLDGVKQVFSSSVLIYSGGQIGDYYLPGSYAVVCSAFSDRSNYELVDIDANAGSLEPYRGNEWLWDASVDLVINYYFSSKFKVAFDANGGTGSIDTQSFVRGQSQKLTKNTNKITKDKYKFVGWNTEADGTGTSYGDNAEGCQILAAVGGVAGATVTLYAQWEYSSFNITVDKKSTESGSADVSGIGELSLFDYTNNRTVATETDGTLYYEGTAEGSTTYKVVCSMPDEKPSSLWSSKGVYDNGSYVADYSFVPTEGTVISKSFYFERKSLFSVSVSVHVLDASGTEIEESVPSCTASVTSPTEADDEGKYVYGRAVTITGVPAEGYALTLARVGGDDYSDIQNNSFTIPSLNSDVTAHCYFTKTKYLLKAGVDSASSSVISSVTVDNGEAQEATYGDTVTYRATVASGADPVFDGWYDGENRVSTQNPYSHSVTGSVTLVAKAKVSVSLGIHYGDETHKKSCSLSVDGSSYVPSTAFDVTLGKSFTFELVLGALDTGSSELWKIDSWYNASDYSRSNPLEYGTSETIAPVSNLSLVVDVTSSVLVKTLSVMLKNDEGDTGIVVANALSTYPEADSKSYDQTTGKYAFSFNGSKRVRLSSVETISVGENALAFSGFKDSGILHSDPDYSFFLTSANKSITAYYGSTGTRKTTLVYGSAGGEAGNRTMGTFSISSTDDPNGSISADGTCAEIHRGSHVTIVAEPKNGYKFAGWYTSREIGGSPYLVGTTVTMTVTTERTLYAWFAKDPNAVYEWEGSSENKSLEWRSKTYASSRPFNPTCARSDTEGYPLISLRVDMFSAPDTDPTASSELTNMASQNVRRLPIRRPERYMQICVKNDREVDAVLVGTNMTELAQ